LCERTNGILFNMVRPMLAHSNAPRFLWGEALNTATYARNRSPLKALNGITPFEAFNGRAPTTDKLHTFGCDAYVTLLPSDRTKVGNRAWLGIYLGYSATRNAIRVLHPVSGRVTITRDYNVIETSFTAIKQLYQPLTVTNKALPAVANNGAATDSDVGELAIATQPIPLPTISVPQGDNENDSSDTMSFNDSVSPPDSPTLSTVIENDESEGEMNESKYDDTDDEISTESYTTPFSDTVVTYNDLYSQQPTTTRSGRTVKSVARYGVLDPNDLALADRHTLNQVLAVSSINEDLSLMRYDQAMRRPDKDMWVGAMDEETVSLCKNGVYTIVQLPDGFKAIPSRWLYRIKHDSENKPTRYKARVVGDGRKQVYGIDYEDTFAPVAKMKSIKLLLSIASHYKMQMKQLDYSTAFLNAPLRETVYLKIPPGIPHLPGEVWKLNKALYGLKQAPMEWNTEVDTYLKTIGYTATAADPCIYVKKTTTSRIILCLYVDDTIVLYNDIDEKQWLKDKSRISNKYEIKDLGDCEWILNMKVTRNAATGEITLSQSAYIDKMLEQHGMTQCKSVANPHINSELTRATDAISDSPPLSPTAHAAYRSIIGGLLYAANQTRIDISYTVGVLCRFLSTPRRIHLNAAKHLLKYLSGTKDYCLSFKPNATVVISTATTKADTTTNTTTIKTAISAYCDSSWANDLSDRKSTTGVVVKLFGNTVCWLSKKQSTVALSSTEGEYMAMSDAVRELIWLRLWVREVLDITDTATLLTDSTAAKAMTTNPLNHQRTKHIDVRHHFVRDNIASGAVVTLWISTVSQHADLLTKCMPIKPFVHLRDTLLVNGACN
jgi:hypothetical protein